MTLDIKKDLHPVKIKTTLYGEKTISYQAPTFWNKLPKNLKATTSAPYFQIKIKEIHTLKY